MRTTLIMGTALIVLMGADTPSPKPTDAEKIQGTWVLREWYTSGQETDRDDVRSGKLTLFIGDGYYHRLRQIGGGAVLGESSGRFVLRPDKSLKEIDLTSYPDGRTRATFPGIYKLEGDTLTIASLPPGVGRPTRFVTEKGDDVTVQVYERDRTKVPHKKKLGAAPLASSDKTEKTDQAEEKDKASADVDRLQGTWVLTKWYNSGRDYIRYQARQGLKVAKEEIIFEGHTYAYRSDGVISDRFRGAFVLRTETTPKEIDLTPNRVPDGKPPFKPSFQIYKIEGDTLTMAHYAYGLPRPRGFTPRWDDFVSIRVYERAKPANGSKH
jgi:uncharacterized protein (TIGR03067 family)